MGSLLLGLITLSLIFWIASKANAFHNTREKEAVCPRCTNRGAKRIMKGSTKGRHECNKCGWHFNY